MTTALHRPPAPRLSTAARARAIVLTGVLAASCVPPPASAAGKATLAPPAAAPASYPSDKGPAWNQLAPAQRQVLATLSTEWNDIDAARKQKWLEVATRFPSMTAAERQRVHERMAEWVRMSPQQRTQARLNFQQARDVSVTERRARWQAYQALPEAQKRALAERALPSSTPASASWRSRHPPLPLDDVQPKSNLVRNGNPVSGATRAVTPVVVQARPGATTTLVTKITTPPRHQPVGQPKIAIGPADVDGTTLLPRRGLQVAALPMKSASRPASAHRPTVLSSSSSGPSSAVPMAAAASVPSIHTAVPAIQPVVLPVSPPAVAPAPALTP